MKDANGEMLLSLLLLLFVHVEIIVLIKVNFLFARPFRAARQFSFELHLLYNVEVAEFVHCSM